MDPVHDPLRFSDISLDVNSYFLLYNPSCSSVSPLITFQNSVITFLAGPP